jgi:uncharacterized tellurite resistance protein B-like protein
MGWFSKKKTDEGTKLMRAVRAELAGADDTLVRVVASVTGLLGQVAYIDRHYVPAEEERIRQELARVEGLSPAGVEAICKTLRDNIHLIAEVEARDYATTLRDLADRPLRLEVLDVLLDVAAADQVVSLTETNLIRRLADVLGLTQAEYNASQERHREKLSLLKALGR